MLDKNGKEIRAGDTLFNPWDADQYHQVIEGTDGRLYLGDLGSPLECYAPDKYWEISNNKIRDEYGHINDNWRESFAHEAHTGFACENLSDAAAEETPDPNPAPNAPSILREAAQTIEDRAARRDLPAERSMARAVGAFNTLTGQDLTETQGWLFVAVLKLARATAGKHNPDDLLDAAAYVALALESEMGGGR